MYNNISLGELLLETGTITKEQLDEAVGIQLKSGGKPIEEILLSFGYINEKQLMKAYEYRYRIPLYDLAAADPAPELAQLISHETARKYTLVPISRENGSLTVATSNPMNFRAIDDVKLESRLEVKTVLAAPSDIKSAIVKLYERSQTDETLEDVNKEFTIEDVGKLSEITGDNVDNAPIVRLVNLLITHAISSRASDIHIEPMENKVRIRFRIDGELYEQLNITKPAHAAIVTRIKIMGEMDIAEKRLPQDGRVRTVFSGMNVDLRLSVLPTVTGEKIVIRILGGRGSIPERKQLGFTEENSALFDEILRSTNGIILVAGPTGSGKSTTLYSVLSELNKPGTNIITVEDPVEYRLQGVNQVQVNPKAGLTFASGLRSILRQDPDIIMIGEIRDAETAEIAVRASITGHLVLSTIHTNDSASTVTRLVDMGIEPFLVSASLAGVVSQRLVRRICSECKTSREATPEERSLLVSDHSCKVYEGKGCQKCGNTGYKGRIAIHEILVMNKAVRELVTKGSSADSIRQAAIESGTKTLRQSCALQVLKGVTTADELVRVAYDSDRA
ncbi:MAG: GspE/PulE family protein [Eubacteriales bacterium]|nr:GspE/PulE family protein [Eubacteriales bacterium]